MKLDQVNQFLSKELLTVGDTHITILGLAMFFIILLITYFATLLSVRFFTRLSEKVEEERKASIYILQRFAHYLIIGAGVFLALTVMGIDLSHLALLATGLSVGIGFGLQSIFNNFFSGIIVLTEKSLKIGDFIELDGGVSGVVKEINIRSTLIRTRDNIDILVPNSEFVNGRVTNWTLGDPTSRHKIPFGVAYGSDKELVKKAALEAAQNVPCTLYSEGKEPDVWLVNFGESSLDFELVVWVDPRLNKKPGGIKAAYCWELETALKKYGLEIPFPQRDIHIKNS